MTSDRGRRTDRAAMSTTPSRPRISGEAGLGQRRAGRHDRPSAERQDPVRTTAGGCGCALENYLERTISGRRLEFSDRRSQALARSSHLRRGGTPSLLNEIGRDDATLPLRNPREAGGTSMQPPGVHERPLPLAQAWDLIGACASRDGGRASLHRIVDSGFWFDAATTPRSDGEASIRDLGTGGPRWNTVTDTGTIPSGQVRSELSRHRVASAAAAAVGNTRLRGLGRHGRRSATSTTTGFGLAKTAMIRCAQWGIPFAVYSGGFSAAIEFFFDSDSWNRTSTGRPTTACSWSRRQAMEETAAG